MMKLSKHYRRPVLIAILIHIALFSILILTVAPKMFRAPPASAPTPTIHATAIVQSAVQPVAVNHAAEEKVRQEKIEKEKQIEIKKQAEVAAKKMLALRQEKEAKIKAAEKIKKEKVEKEKLAKAVLLKKQQQKLADEKAKKLAQAKKLTAEQKALQQKLMQQALNSEQKSLVAAQSQQGEIDKYKAEILALVQSNWRIDRVNDQLKCIYSVSLAPDGSVLSATLVKSSGDDNLDQSARQAIMQSSPLPVPQNPSEFDHFRQLVLTLSPQGFVHQ